jgi:hypothetical protein
MTDSALENRFTIQIRGSSVDDEDVRLSDLIAQLQSVREVLTQIDRQYSNSRKPTVYYKVVDLKHSSPSAVTLEAVAVENSVDRSTAVVRGFISGLKKIKSGQRPADADYLLLEGYRKMASVKNIQGLQIIGNEVDGTVDVTPEIETQIARILWPEEIGYGSVSGMLEALNLHNDANLFTIYPSVGPSRITCKLPRNLLQAAILGVNRHVLVSGEAHYKSSEKYPHFIAAEQIEVYPDESDLPRLSELRGIAKRVVREAAVEGVDDESW